MWYSCVAGAWVVHVSHVELCICVSGARCNVVALQVRGMRAWDERGGEREKKLEGERGREV